MNLSVHLHHAASVASPADGWEWFAFCLFGAFFVLFFFGPRAGRGGGSGMAAAAFLVLSGIIPGQVAAVCAAPGGGKTRTSQEAAKRMRRAVVFDPYAARDNLNWQNGERRRTPWNVALPGASLVTIGDLLRAPEILDSKRLQLVVQPSTLDRFGMGRDFAALVNLCWHTGGDIGLFAEECALYGRESLEAILRVASGGAHGGMSLTLICQSMGRIPKDGRRHIQIVVAGPQGEPTDFDDLRGRCGREFTARVRQLRLGDAPLVWRLGDDLGARGARTT